MTLVKIITNVISVVKQTAGKLIKGLRVPVPPPTEWHKDKKKYNRKKKHKKPKLEVKSNGRSASESNYSIG